MDARTLTTSATRDVGRFLSGVGLLLRGLRMYAGNRRLVLLGILPALITGLLFIGAFATLASFVTDLASAVTPFADTWSAWARDTMRVFAAAAMLGASALVGVLTFTAVTLAVGDPFYEKISQRVEELSGGVPNAVEVPWTRSLGQSLADSARLVAVSVLVGIPLFAAGFLPVVGQTVVPVVGAAVGGWFLALELVSAAFYRRGLRLRDRRRALRSVRPVALGFGVAVFVVFLIPLGAIVFTPAAVAGATLLARHSLGEPVRVMET